MKGCGPNPNPLTRRSFLQAAAPLVLGLTQAVRGQTVSAVRRFGEADLPYAQTELLALVNSERAYAGLGALQLDELACRVASAHADDMLSRRFLAHWGSDGRKPYQRCSFAGGHDAVQENVSSADNLTSPIRSYVVADLLDMHTSMYLENPPDDGHRRTILYPFHTHVGFGIAFKEDSLRLDELYLSKYVEIAAATQQTRPKSKVRVNGRIFNPNHELISVDVYYESLPSAPSIDWLRERRPVGMPKEHVTLMPRLPGRYVYEDGSTGIIELDNKARFRMPVSLFKDEPGIYTIVVWLQEKKTDKPFPATQLCIWSE